MRYSKGDAKSLKSGLIKQGNFQRIAEADHRRYLKQCKRDSITFYEGTDGKIYCCSKLMCMHQYGCGFHNFEKYN